MVLDTVPSQWSSEPPREPFRELLGSPPSRRPQWSSVARPIRGFQTDSRSALEGHFESLVTCSKVISFRKHVGHDGNSFSRTNCVRSGDLEASPEPLCANLGRRPQPSLAWPAHTRAPDQLARGTRGVPSKVYYFQKHFGHERNVGLRERVLAEGIGSLP